MKAPEILKRAAQHMEDRAASRDQAGGERSMARTVAAFNAITGHQLSERDGWLFMAQLKMARATTTPTGIADDYEDGAAYFALAGESVAQPVNDNAEQFTIEIPMEGGRALYVPPGYNWIAQDGDGRWFAYAVEPKKMRGGQWSVSHCGGSSHPPDTLFLCLGALNHPWSETLRQVRP